MVSKNVPAKAGAEAGDLLTKNFRASMSALEDRRTEKRRLADQIKSVEATSLQPENLQLESQAARHSAAEQSREHAARCLELAEEANFRKLKEFFLAEADGWRRLAEQQEQKEKRSLKTAISLPSS